MSNVRPNKTSVALLRASIHETLACALVRSLAVSPSLDRQACRGQIVIVLLQATDAPAQQASWEEIFHRQWVDMQAVLFHRIRSEWALERLRMNAEHLSNAEHVQAATITVQMQDVEYHPELFARAFLFVAAVATSPEQEASRQALRDLTSSVRQRQREFEHTIAMMMSERASLAPPIAIVDAPAEPNAPCDYAFAA